MSPQRRNVIKVIGGSAIGLSVAGCVGGQNGNGNGENGTGEGTNGEGDGDGPYTVIYGGAPSGSTAFARGQAMQSVFDEHSDAINLSTQETAGQEANIRLYDEGEIEAYSANINVINQALEGEDPFDDPPIDNIPYVSWNTDPTAQMWMALEETDVYTTDDMIEQSREGDITIWPVSPGASMRAMGLSMLEANDVNPDELDISNVDIPDIAGTVDEGNVDVVLGYGWNGTSPGWLSEIDNRFDIRGVEPTDEFLQNALDHRDTITIETPVDEIDLQQGLEIEENWGTDTVTTWAAVGFEFWDPAIPDEAIYDATRMCIELNDEINAAADDFPDFEEIDQLLENIPNSLPVHPGAAEYYRDQGVWDDYDLEEGE